MGSIRVVVLVTKVVRLMLNRIEVSLRNSSSLVCSGQVACSRWYGSNVADWPVMPATEKAGLGRFGEAESVRLTRV